MFASLKRGRTLTLPLLRASQTIRLSSDDLSLSSGAMSAEEQPAKIFSLKDPFTHQEHTHQYHQGKEQQLGPAGMQDTVNHDFSEKAVTYFGMMLLLSHIIQVHGTSVRRIRFPSCQ